MQTNTIQGLFLKCMCKCNFCHNFVCWIWELMWSGLWNIRTSFIFISFPDIPMIAEPPPPPPSLLVSCKNSASSLWWSYCTKEIVCCLTHATDNIWFTWWSRLMNIHWYSACKKCTILFQIHTCVHMICHHQWRNYMPTWEAGAPSLI